MRTMGAENVIGFLQCGTDACRDCLLTCVEVDGTFYFPPEDGFYEAFFAKTCSDHRPVQFFKKSFRIHVWESRRDYCSECLKDYFQVNEK